MTTVKKDITTVEHGIIVHQVNCQGKMASGVANTIKEKWPVVFSEFNRFNSEFFSADRLGKVQFVRVQATPDIHVVNLFGQLYYGRDGKRYTSYAAWEKALPELLGLRNAKALALHPIYFPKNIGCGLGGGDVRIIEAMIEEYFPNAIFCRP